MNARVHGDVYYHTIEMAGGAEINGKLVRSDQVSQRYLEHHGRGDEQAGEAGETGSGEAGPAQESGGEPEHRAAGPLQS